MQKYKQAAVSIALLTFLLTAGISSGYIVINKPFVQSNYTQAQQEAILSTFENNDYDSWKKLIKGKKKIAAVVSARDFQNFVAAREAARTGDYDTAISISRTLETELKSKLG